MSDVQTKLGIGIVATGGSGARAELVALWNEFKAGKMSVEEFNQEMRNTSGAIYAQRRVIMLLRTEYRNQRAALYEAMRGFRAVARIGRTITSVYQTYTLMQMRVADKTRDVRDTQERLAEVQVRRKRVVDDLGATNAIAIRLMNEEDRLTKRLTEDRRGLKQAQDQNIIGYTGIALQALQVIPTVVSLARHIDLTKIYLKASGWEYTGLTGIVTSAAAAKVSILGIKTTYLGLATLLAIPIVVKIGWDVMSGLADKVNKELEDAGLPVTTKKPGDEGMTGIWPGVYLDEDLADEYRKFQEETEEVFGPGGGFGGVGGSVRDGDETTVTTEGENIDVEVKVVVTKYSPWAGDERLR